MEYSRGISPQGKHGVASAVLHAAAQQIALRGIRRQGLAQKRGVGRDMDARDGYSQIFQKVGRIFIAHGDDIRTAVEHTRGAPPVSLLLNRADAAAVEHDAAARKMCQLDRKKVIP